MVASGQYRFGAFELNLSARELRKHGIKVVLRGQPFEILCVLLERPNEVVSREELQQHLWPNGTFVDFEHSLNTAIKRLRNALADTHENPRYIETIPKIGYRFVAPVERVAPAKHNGEATREPTGEARVEGGGVRRATWIAAAGLVVLAIVIVLMVEAREPRALRLAGMTQITHSGRVDNWGRLVTDGPRLYFLERNGDHWDAMEVAAAGGQERRLDFPFRSARILGISGDSSEFLVGEFTRREEEMPLWRIPVLGGAPRRVGVITAREADWSPDGREILVLAGNTLRTVDPNGKELRTLGAYAGALEKPNWSPDGGKILFSARNLDTSAMSLWQINRDGSGLREWVQEWSRDDGLCCASWWKNDRSIVFSSAHGSQRMNLWWAWQEGWPARASEKRGELTTGPLACMDSLSAKGTGKLYAVCFHPHGELIRYDLKRKEFVSYIAGLEVQNLEVSADRQWIVYGTTEENSIWRARVDGSQAKQLTFGGYTAMRPRWSPDGGKIAFTAREPGKNWRVYVMPADGGTPLSPVSLEGDQTDADWSPDGKQLLFCLSAGGARE